jgi:hypothetical protein
VIDAIEAYNFRAAEGRDFVGSVESGALGRSVAAVDSVAVAVFDLTVFLLLTVDFPFAVLLLLTRRALALLKVICAFA